MRQSAFTAAQHCKIHHQTGFVLDRQHEPQRFKPARRHTIPQAFYRTIAIVTTSSHHIIAPVAPSTNNPHTTTHNPTTQQPTTQQLNKAKQDRSIRPKHVISPHPLQ
jgi:hypothetical protein